MTDTNMAGEVLVLARLATYLGEEKLETRHPNGQPETVATHTAMLGLVACTVAARSDGFDLGLVAQFALVHDVSKVAPGAEAKAIARLGVDHPAWLGPLATRYQAQDCPESRLVYYLDKILPKLTLVMNNCGQLQRTGALARRTYFENFIRRQRATLAAEYPELEDICGVLYDVTTKMVRSAWPL